MDSNEEYYKFLDNLRESCVTNMFGATPYLVKAFSELSEVEAREILGSWMRTFSEGIQNNPSKDEIQRRGGGNFGRFR